jgi:hypothetical protein
VRALCRGDDFLRKRERSVRPKFRPQFHRTPDYAASRVPHVSLLYVGLLTFPRLLQTVGQVPALAPGWRTDCRLVSNGRVGGWQRPNSWPGVAHPSPGEHHAQEILKIGVCAKVQDDRIENLTRRST